MLRLDPFRRTNIAASLHQVLPPDIAPRPHSATAASPLEHNNALNRAAASLKRLIHGLLQLDSLPATPSTVCGDHHLRAGILNTILHCICGKSAKHHRMHRPNTRTGLHGNDGLRYHGHIDDYAIPFLDALSSQRIAQARNFAVQFPVSQLAYITRFALEHYRELVGVMRKMHVETVIRNVKLTIDKPAVIGSLIII